MFGLACVFVAIMIIWSFTMIMLRRDQKRNMSESL